MKIQCVECKIKGHNIPAEFMYLDEVTDDLKPLCSSHMDDYIRIFGEMSIEFCHIESDAEILKIANTKLLFWSRRYSDLLRKHSGGRMK